MSISQVTRVKPPSGGVRLSAALDDLDLAAGALAVIDARELTDREALAGVRRLVELANRLAASRLALLAEVDRRGAVGRATGATSTAAWLRSTGVGAGAAVREVELAGGLTRHEATRDALTSGGITADQAAVISGALDRMSDDVGAEVVAAAERRLLDNAARLDPTGLRKFAAAQAARVDPHGSGDLAARERRMRARRDLTISRERDGMHRVAGLLDPEGAAHVVTALDALARPRPSTEQGPDPRTPGQRRADALVELAQLASMADRLPDSGGVRPTVLVTIEHDALRGAVSDAGLLTGGPLAEPISVETVRKVACDAGILPAVLGGRSAVLDLGREERTATRWQRYALVLRDGPTCAFPGCDRPAAWTKAHHLVHWAEGGRTDLDNLVLICGAHHDCVHHDGWTVAMGEDGRPEFHPPSEPPPEPPPDPPPDGLPW